MRAGHAGDAVGRAALVERVVVLPALVGRPEVVHASEGLVLAGGEVFTGELSAPSGRKAWRGHRGRRVVDRVNEVP